MRNRVKTARCDGCTTAQAELIYRSLVGALPCPAIAHVRFKHLEKVVKGVEQPTAQYIGEVIVQQS